MRKHNVRYTGSLKVVTLLFGGLLMLTLLTAPSQGQAAGKAYKITILGGSAGGMWSVMTEGVAESIRRSLPDARVTTEPGKDGPNQVMVSKKQVEFAVTNESTSYAAAEGLMPYKERFPNIRTVAVLNPTSPFQFFVDGKTGITSFQQIKEKRYPLRVGVNQKGSLMQICGEKVLEAYGITFEDILKWGGKIHYVRARQSMDLWDAGQLDATSEVMQFPASAYIELSQKHKLVMLPVAPDKVPGLTKLLGMPPFTIPANAYPFQKEAYTTINTKLILISSVDEPAEMVYDVVKAMYTNLNYLHKVHANLRGLTGEIMVKEAMVELHPGAAKFYREIGVIK
jgi:TRAP transporter TAXI family solute receptor